MKKKLVSDTSVSARRYRFNNRQKQQGKGGDNVDKGGVISPQNQDDEEIPSPTIDEGGAPCPTSDEGGVPYPPNVEVGDIVAIAERKRLYIGKVKDSCHESEDKQISVEYFLSQISNEGLVKMTKTNTYDISSVFIIEIVDGEFNNNYFSINNFENIMNHYKKYKEQYL